MSHESMITSEISLPDGRVELRDRQRIEASPLYNEDLAPVPIARRTWTTYNYAALWISMAHCIPTYMLSAGLMATGMSWSQALFTVALGNSIVLIPILLNSHPGTRYGIPFPVFARAAYGTLGSNVPALFGRYVFADYCSGTIWSIPRKPGSSATKSLVLNTGMNISSFGESASNELYVIDRGGAIYRFDAP